MTWSGGDDELAVVPGHVALLVAHHPHVRVGGVRPRLGPGPVARAARRPGGGRRAVSRPPRPRPRLPAWPAARRGAPGPRPPAGPGPRGQPLPPLSPAGQRPRRRRLRVVAGPGVFGGVSRGRLGEQLLDLRQRPVRLLRGVAGQLGAIQAERAQRHHALRGQQPQHLAEQPAQRLLMPGPEPGDGRVIRVQAAGDHPVAHIAHAPLLDHPAGPLALAVPVQQQRRPSSPGRMPPARAHRPGTGGGTRPGPGWPPRPARRTPDRPPAATRACPPASATADHAADKGNSAA